MTTPTTTTTYTVKPGDTLYSLAREFNTTVNNLKTLNNLTTNNLAIGQTILIN
ncbi:MAG: LysM domain-containing protein [Bacilli bacterium]|nr:LysM domain-containing protein [Bacilli bacterium]